MAQHRDKFTRTRHPYHMDKKSIPAVRMPDITPICKARQMLGNTVSIRDGSYYFEGHPITFHELVAEANKILEERGQKTILLAREEL